MGLVDTNCDPDPIQYVIACNDDALKSIKLILQALAQAIIDKKNDLTISYQKEGDKPEEDIEVLKKAFKEVDVSEEEV